MIPEWHGRQVKWTTASGVNGSGQVVQDYDELHVLVAVDALVGEEHRVIFCTKTWLTKVD